MISVPSLIRFLLFFLLVVLGFGLELLFSKVYYKLTKKPHKTHHYSLGKYAYFLTLPILVTIYFLYGSNLNLPAVFVSFAVLGTFAEWLIGYFYHKIVGQRLWTYHRYAISGYTSFLSVPLWGMAGLILYLFSQIFV